ncbi:uncharacterized protein LOC114748635 isoform X2 [Neltuma alba]|uniref:uncharacterized protein LOC114748635 isoform X2 n=1 Tax=Neltuma alba TaxID=207710 RepID=UPI0010A48204|nr:uncharacterized protein LOC114748635 isoform X2 [Prosopis alba]
MTLSVSEFRSWQLWAPIPLVALVCRLPLSAIGLLFYPDQRKNDMILSRQGQPRKARMRLYQAEIRYYLFCQEQYRERRKMRVCQSRALYLMTMYEGSFSCCRCCSWP